MPDLSAGVEQLPKEIVKSEFEWGEAQEIRQIPKEEIRPGSIIEWRFPLPIPRVPNGPTKTKRYFYIIGDPTDETKEKFPEETDLFTTGLNVRPSYGYLGSELVYQQHSGDHKAEPFLNGSIGIKLSGNNTLTLYRPDQKELLATLEDGKEEFYVYPVRGEKTYTKIIDLMSAVERKLPHFLKSMSTKEKQRNSLTLATDWRELLHLGLRNRFKRFQEAIYVRL